MEWQPLQGNLYLSLLSKVCLGSLVLTRDLLKVLWILNDTCIFVIVEIPFEIRLEKKGSETNCSDLVEVL